MKNKFCLFLFPVLFLLVHIFSGIPVCAGQVAGDYGGPENGLSESEIISESEELSAEGVENEADEILRQGYGDGEYEILEVNDGETVENSSEAPLIWGGAELGEPLDDEEEELLQEDEAGSRDEIVPVKTRLEERPKSVEELQAEVERIVQTPVVNSKATGEVKLEWNVGLDPEKVVPEPEEKKNQNSLKGKTDVRQTAEMSLESTHETMLNRGGEAGIRNGKTIEPEARSRKSNNRDGAVGSSKNQEKTEPEGVKGTFPVTAENTGSVSSDVFLRSGPGGETSVVMTLKAGMVVTILDDNRKGWYRIRLEDGREGWVAAKFISRKRR